MLSKFRINLGLPGESNVFSGSGFLVPYFLKWLIFLSYCVNGCFFSINDANVLLTRI